MANKHITTTLILNQYNKYLDKVSENLVNTYNSEIASLNAQLTTLNTTKDDIAKKLAKSIKGFNDCRRELTDLGIRMEKAKAALKANPESEEAKENYNKIKNKILAEKAVQNTFATQAKELNTDLVACNNNIKAKIAEIEALTAQHNNALNNITSPESFKAFLLQAGYSDVHYAELFAYIIEGNQLPVIENFKLRKNHPRLNYFIKKILIPATVSGIVGGTLLGAVAATSAVAGSTVLGNTISSIPAQNFFNFFTPGFLIGAGSSVGTILIKNSRTIKSYKKKYGTYASKFKGKNSDLSKLMNLVAETKDNILALRESSGNFVSKSADFFKRHSLNAVNRNRIHHIQFCAKELLHEYYSLTLDKDTNKETLANNEEILAIIDTLKTIKEFIASDIENSKLYALLDCHNSKENHAHMIENLDIYTEMYTYAKVLAENPTLSAKAIKAKVNTILKIPAFKKAEETERQQIASELLNNPTVMFNEVFTGFDALTPAEQVNNSQPVTTNANTTVNNIANLSSVTRTPKDPTLDKGRITQRGILSFLEDGNNAEIVAQNLGIDSTFVTNFIKALQNAKVSGKKLSYTSLNYRNKIRDEVCRLINTNANTNNSQLEVIENVSGLNA